MKINDGILMPHVIEHTSRDGSAHVEVEARVVDRWVREKFGQDFDGYEKVFALVPYHTRGGSVNWVRHELQYETTSTGREGIAVDLHRLVLPSGNTDMSAIAEHGIAFGMDIHNRNGGEQTVWAQTVDDNYKPY